MNKYLDIKKKFNVSTKKNDWRDLELFLFNRLFHLLIKKGKKAKALNTFLKVIQGLKETKFVETENLRPIQIIYQGLNNIKPLLSVTWKKARGRKMWYVPKLVTKEQQLRIALSWLVKNVNYQKDRKLHQRFLKEILESYAGTGYAMAKKQKNYDVIKAQRPFINLYMFKKK